MNYSDKQQLLEVLPQSNENSMLVDETTEERKQPKNDIENIPIQTNNLGQSHDSNEDISL